MVTSDLKLKPEGEENNALNQIELFASRINEKSSQLKNWCASEKTIEYARSILSNFEELEKLIPIIKKIEERSIWCHNRLYDRK